MIEKGGGLVTVKKHIMCKVGSRADDGRMTGIAHENGIRVHDQGIFKRVDPRRNIDHLQYQTSALEHFHKLVPGYHIPVA